MRCELTGVEVCYLSNCDGFLISAEQILRHFQTRKEFLNALYKIKLRRRQKQTRISC